MTWRGAALLAGPIPLVALGATFPPLLPIGIVLFVLSAGIILLDSRLAAGGSMLEVVREHDDLLSIGRPNTITLHISSTRPARGVLRDEHPEDMDVATELHVVNVPATLEYALTPRARGEAQFGRTVLRLTGPLGVGTRQTAVGEPQGVRVDPDLTAVRSYEALARRGQLMEIGMRSMRRHGEGTEFERVREAVPDDPLRSINWKATARTGKLMALELMPERAQPIVICMDHGRLMGVGAGSLTKLDHSINAALLLAHVALRFGDKAGLLAFCDRVTTSIAPRAGRSQLRAIIDGLRPLEAGQTEADYESAFTFLSGWQTRRSLLVIFTDMLDADQGAALIRQCVRLRRRHLPLVITVRDPAVDDTAEAPPTSALRVYERAVASGLARDREDTIRILQRSGVETIDTDARTLSPRLVNRYIDLKRRARL